MATEVERTESPLVVIVGPTASGKTALAIELAEQLNGEIICADSRTIYRGMDIGTAKPSQAERERVRHWGLDLVEPDEHFTAADFKTYAYQVIGDIRSRGKIPFLVGGSGLYVDAVLFDFEFGDEPDKQLRAHLESLGLEELYLYCKENNIELPENRANKRYVVRAIERHGSTLKSRSSPLSSSIIVGIATEKVVLRERITARSEQLFLQDVVEEARRLGEMYGWDHESMTGNIYPLVREYSQGSISLDEVKTKFAALDWRLAKRQLTWFRRNPYIVWLTNDEAGEYIRERVAASY